VGTLSKILVNDAMLTPTIRYTHQYVSGAVSLEKDTLFDSQYIQPNNISDKIIERAWITGNLPMRSVEEFRNNPRLDVQPWDIPDIIDLDAAIRFLREDADKYSKE
jgi:DNA-binding ferritin-like protein